MANEKRLIDANAMREDWLENGENEYVYDTNAVLDSIDAQPTVDAVEVVHAEWACVNESENVWMCTGKNGCGNEIILLEGTPNENGWHYCPNCGADMRERKDNEI